MVDDQHRCEWMNVSLGTGSPGQFRTKGRKMVVVYYEILNAKALTYSSDIRDLSIFPKMDNLEKHTFVQKQELQVPTIAALFPA